MSRTERRRLSRQRRRQFSHSPGQYWTAPEYIRQPENRKRHTARLVGPCDPTGIDGRYYDPRETAYAPLTVSHPSLTPSGNRSKTRRTQYTV